METHSALSLITFCLPVGLITYWIFQMRHQDPGPGSCRKARMRVLGRRLAIIGSLFQWARAAAGCLPVPPPTLFGTHSRMRARGVHMFPWLDDPFLNSAGITGTP